MIDKNFFSRSAEIVARELLGKVLVVGNRKSRIVETEAYFGSEDPASRACQNGDLRATMLSGGGNILVYGVHNSWMLNFVTGEEGGAQAVLIRAVEPLNFEEKCSGPGLLTRALGIDKNFHKKSVFDEGFFLEEGILDFDIEEDFRIGVREDLNVPMRFYIKGNKFVSKLKK